MHYVVPTLYLNICSPSNW